MNLSKLAQQALMDIPDSIEVVSEGKNFADSTPAYFLKSGKGVIAYTLPEPVARFYEALTPQVVIELLASRSALERECERLQAERGRIYNLCVKLGMYEPDEGKGDVAEFIRACHATYIEQVELANENDRLTALLPRVADATRNAIKLLLMTIPRRSHVFGHDKECLFIGDVEALLDGLDVSAVLESLTGAAER